MIKLVIFDADGVLWNTPPRDYLSKNCSGLELINNDIIKRKSDGALFKINPHLKQILTFLSDKCIKIGLVSDNHRKDIIKALKLFEIIDFFDEKFLFAKLHVGVCPKGQIIKELLENKNILPEEVFFIDDKDYSQQMREISVHFLQYTKMEK